MPDYTRFSCPNQACSLYNQSSLGNIKHRSWTGKHKNIERLLCTRCRGEFSINQGTLRENSKISEEQQVLILKCIRWGVPETGVADIANVSRPTVRRFQKKAGKFAKAHHNEYIVNVKEPVAQCDEMYAKTQGGNSWIGIAMGATTMLILGVVVGMRQQNMADSLMASLWARCAKVPMILTDGWTCYWNAVLRCFGKLYQPRRKEGRGRRRLKSLKLSSRILYAQVVKRAKKVGKRWKLNSVVTKALSGGMEHCKRYICAYGAGSVINTSFVERLNGTFRNCIGALRRKSRCPVKLTHRLNEKVWIFASLYNWVLPHCSLSCGGSLTTPAMAAGLIDVPMSYSQYINTPIHYKPDEESLEARKIDCMSSPDLVAAAKRYKRQCPIEEETRWKEVNEEVAMTG